MSSRKIKTLKHWFKTEARTRHSELRILRRVE